MERGTLLYIIFVRHCIHSARRCDQRTRVISCSLSQLFTAAVERVEVMSLNDTSVTVSWNDLIIPDFSIDYYTVVYSGPLQQQMSAVFPSPSTSGVITDLASPAIYQFQVFATVTVSGRTVDGEKSSPVYFVKGE